MSAENGFLGYSWEPEQPVAKSMPDDWAQLQWHEDPGSKRYRTPATAKRACDWLNTHEHVGDCWLYRPGARRRDGSVRLQRRWIGRWDGLVG